VKQSAFSTFLFFYYNQVLGLSGALAGMAALMALLVDAITDPMVGRLSDRFKSRWGRRHPFMLAGAIPFGIAIMVLFAPPDGLSQMQLFSWMLGGAFAFSPQMVYFTGLLESMSDTAKLILIFSVNGISQIFFIAYIILVDSMLSDVIDEHELNTGKREEGLFFAARSFATKASYGLGSFFAGIGLDIIHFPQGASPDTVPPEAVLSLAIMSGPLMFVLFAATVFVSGRYRLTAKKHAEIMAAIEARTRFTN
jgi:Na+/melibiose symporter-like transporter